MTIVDFILQGISLLMNVFLTKRLGEQMLGVISLVMSFYGTFVVISNGNTFLCANRFISEERGKVKGNANTILGYAVVWSTTLSLVSSLLVIAFADRLCGSILKSTAYTNGIRIVASTLVLTAMTSSIKGYFHAHRLVTIPVVSGCVECIVRNTITIGMVLLTDVNIVLTIAISLLVGESVSLGYLLVSLSRHLHPSDTPTSTTFRRYITSCIPIALNSSIPLILSTCNDALLPITLRQCGSSAEESLALYGTFEGIVLQILFFPSSILCSLSCILVTEVARCNSAKDYARVRRVSFKAIELTLVFSVVVAFGLYIFGDDIATWVGSSPLSGKTVKILSPVVPLIYLEIVLESILKGLGKHGFSSINYIVEYVVRISTLLVCVPLFHFYGIVVSYYASNVVGNVSRIVKVCKVIPRESIGRKIPQPTTDWSTLS
jgi:stage V sporulation protein B